VVIRGFVKGDVVASEKVEITGTGTLEGDVTAPEISMEGGCVFNGRCSMRRPEVSATAGKAAQNG
jgi:cytoskeletal protein CcmA (bactofilin family)